MLRFVLVAIAAMLATLAIATSAAASDPRFCGAPARDSAGKIKRSSAAKAEFARMYACPSTGETSGSCPGWSIDHIIPLACGGCDSPHNMQWLDLRIKSCAGQACKDRWERSVYQTSIPCK